MLAVRGEAVTDTQTSTDTALVLAGELDSPVVWTEFGLAQVPIELYERVVAYLKRPLVEAMREYYAEQQTQIPLTIRDRVLKYVREISARDLAEIVEELEENFPALKPLEKFEIKSLRFGTSEYTNGYFYSDHPQLIMDDAGEIVVEWEDVFGCDFNDPDLSDLTGTLSDVFGPADRDSVLSIDMSDGTASDEDGI